MTKSRARFVFVTSDDTYGGASRAMFRVFQAAKQARPFSAQILLRVVHKHRQENDILGGKPARNGQERIEYLLRTRFRKFFPRRPFHSENKVLHSQALYPSGLARELNSMKPDAILLGWLGSAVLSIPEIGRLYAPVVWRLSDMWLFSGAEHYSQDERYLTGYSRSSRPASEDGPDINRETFRRKKRHWKKQSHIICPSSWMAEQAKKSPLTSDWPVHVIPNPIDTDFWAPRDETAARKRLGLPLDTTVLLFGAGSGTKDSHKGADLLFEGIRRLPHFEGRRVQLAIFGEEASSHSIGQIEVTYLGRLNNDELVDAYSAANIMMVPSRLDNLPSTAVEAHACGTPVIAFRVGGLPDIVDHGKTGLLVTPYDAEELASAMEHLISDKSVREQMGSGARSKAIAQWHPRIVGKQYLDVLQEAAFAGGRVP